MGEGGVSKVPHLPCLLIVREERRVSTSGITPKAPQAAPTPQPGPPPLHIQWPFTRPRWCGFLLSHARRHCCVVGKDTSVESSPRLLSLLHSAPGFSYSNFTGSASSCSQKAPGERSASQVESRMAVLCMLVAVREARTSKGLP